MKRTQRIRRLSKQLLRLCLVNGLLDENRVRRVAQRISESRNRNRLAVLSQFRRLVMLDRVRHTATIESAEPLPSEIRAAVQARLSERYGPGLSTTFTHRPGLIGGMRIQVGSDVYDGSVRGRLQALAARF